MKIQKHRWGQSRTKEGIHGVYGAARHDLSQLPCVCHNSFNSLPSPESSLPLQFGW